MLYLDVRERQIGELCHRVLRSVGVLARDLCRRYDFAPRHQHGPIVALLLVLDDKTGVCVRCPVLRSVGHVPVLSLSVSLESVLDRSALLAP